MAAQRSARQFAQNNSAFAATLKLQTLSRLALLRRANKARQVSFVSREQFASWLLRNSAQLSLLRRPSNTCVAQPDIHEPASRVRTWRALSKGTHECASPSSRATLACRTFRAKRQSRASRDSQRTFLSAKEASKVATIDRRTKFNLRVAFMFIFATSISLCF